MKEKQREKDRQVKLVKMYKVLSKNPETFWKQHCATKQSRKHTSGLKRSIVKVPSGIGGGFLL